MQRFGSSGRVEEGKAGKTLTHSVYISKGAALSDTWGRHDSLSVSRLGVLVAGRDGLKAGVWVECSAGMPLAALKPIVKEG